MTNSTGNSNHKATKYLIRNLRKNINDFIYFLNISRRNIMVEITPSATQQIAEYFKGKDVSPIRIFLNEGG